MSARSDQEASQQLLKSNEHIVHSFDELAKAIKTLREVLSRPDAALSTPLLDMFSLFETKTRAYGTSIEQFNELVNVKEAEHQDLANALAAKSARLKSCELDLQQAQGILESSKSDLDARAKQLDERDADLLRKEKEVALRLACLAGREMAHVTKEKLLSQRFHAIELALQRQSGEVDRKLKELGFVGKQLPLLLGLTRELSWSVPRAESARQSLQMAREELQSLNNDRHELYRKLAAFAKDHSRSTATIKVSLTQQSKEIAELRATLEAKRIREIKETEVAISSQLDTAVDQIKGFAEQGLEEQANVVARAKAGLEHAIVQKPSSDVQKLVEMFGSLQQLPGKIQEQLDAICTAISELGANGVNVARSGPDEVEEAWRYAELEAGIRFIKSTLNVVCNTLDKAAACQGASAGEKPAPNTREEMQGKIRPRLLDKVKAFRSGKLSLEPDRKRRRIE